MENTDEGSIHFFGFMLMVTYSITITVGSLLMFAYIIYLRMYGFKCRNCWKSNKNKFVPRGVVEEIQEESAASDRCSYADKKIMEKFAHQYETIIKALSENKELLWKIYGFSKSQDNEKENKFVSQLKEETVNRDNANCSNKKYVYKEKNDKEEECNLYEEMQLVSMKDPYEEDNSYAKFVNLPKRNANTTLKNNMQVIESYGSNDHLKFLKEYTESAYMEPRIFVPRENCPDTLRSLCSIKSLTTEEKPPSVPKKKKVYFTPFR